MDQLDALAQTFDHATKVVAGIADDQLGLATPCREWDVRHLLSHAMGVVVNMGNGASCEELLPDVNTYALRDDRAAQFRAEADRTLAAWTTRGLAGEVNIGAGPMPAEAGIGINLLDTATHSWDISRATGQGEELPDDLATFVLALARGFVSDQIRSFAGFDPEVPVPAEASPTAQLAAFLGRKP